MSREMWFTCEIAVNLDDEILISTERRFHVSNPTFC